MAPEDERFNAKVTVLMETVRHHVVEEEEEYFPKVRDELGRKALDELGDGLMAAKKTAPTTRTPSPPTCLQAISSLALPRASPTASATALVEWPRAAFPPSATWSPWSCGERSHPHDRRATRVPARQLKECEAASTMPPMQSSRRRRRPAKG